MARVTILWVAIGLALFTLGAMLCTRPSQSTDASPQCWCASEDGCLQDEYQGDDDGDGSDCLAGTTGEDILPVLASFPVSQHAGIVATHRHLPDLHERGPPGSESDRTVPRLPPS